MLKDTLLDNGYDIMLANNGEEGLDRARNDHPDLIIADINMPKMVGSTMVARLSVEERTKNIPVIFLTGYIDEEEARELHHQLAGNKLLTKPFETQILLDLIKELVGE